MTEKVSYIREKDAKLNSFVCNVGRFLVSVLIVYYVFYNERYGHNTMIVYGSFVVLFICICINLFFEGAIVFRDFHVGIWVNFIIGIYCIFPGYFVAFYTKALLENVKTVLQYAFIIFSAFYLAQRTKNGIEWVLITINVAALICFYSLLTNPFSKIGGRYSLSELNNPNTLGVAFVMGMFSVAYRFKPSFARSLISLLQSGIMLYGIMLTGSRKSFITAIILFVFFIWNMIKENRAHLKGHQKGLFTIVLFIIIFFSLRYLIDFYNNSDISSRMNSMADDDSNDNRIYFYQKAFEVFLEKPFFGGGLEQFRYWSGIGSYAHSTYAESIADFGLVGCLIYYYPILLTGFRIVSKIRNGKTSYQTKLIAVLYIGEMFLGIGQIFFLDIYHYLMWLILYLSTNEHHISNGIKCKYIQ